MTSGRACVTLSALCAVVACNGAGADADDGARHRVAGQEERSAAQQPSCRATRTSLTPPEWHAPIPASPTDAPRGALRLVADVPLPGPANRFDYQSVDP
ncbi:MAG TPA: hypothetical protein VNS52_16580, partial [Gemmatimonadaceae bacterium]|nr:hypothetical protein [Gemmatimonadaceae bacterium]